MVKNSPGDGEIKLEVDSFHYLYIRPTLSLKGKPFLSHPLLFTHFRKQSHMFPFSFPPFLHISPRRSYVTHLWTGEWMLASLPQPSASKGSTSVWHSSEVAIREWQNEFVQVGREILEKSFSPWWSLALLSCLVYSFIPIFFPVDFFSWFLRKFLAMSHLKHQDSPLQILKSIGFGILSIFISKRSQK